MALSIDQIDAFCDSMHEKYEKEDARSAQDLSLKLQEYMFASRLLDPMKSGDMTTDMCRWKVKVKYNDNFQVVGLYHRDSSSRVSGFDEGQLKWGLTTNNYHYDIDENVFRQGGRQIYDYLKELERDLDTSYFTGMEDLMFSEGPALPTTDPFPPVSLLWWITTTAASDSSTINGAAEGFNGYEPVNWGSVGVGGISCDTYDQWRNRTFPYKEISRSDFVEKTINSMDMCEFKPPVERPDIVEQTRPNWELLTTHSRVAKARQLLQLGNDNIGADLAANSKGVMIRGVPMVWVPAWTNANSDNKRDDGIILGVNWKTFEWKSAAGRRNRRHKAHVHPDMLNVRIRKRDDSGQIICYNRRANFRGYCENTVTETT